VADLKISELPALAGTLLAATDPLALADLSASETKKITAKDLIQAGVALIDDASIPGSKVSLNLAPGSIGTAELEDGAVTAAKLADQSSAVVQAGLPAAGAYVGQMAVNTTDNRAYIWNGSAWDAFKGAGSINTITYNNTVGPIAIAGTVTGDNVELGVLPKDTTAAAQFLAGPTGAGGTADYRSILGTDLPTATTTTKGAVVVNGFGLRIDGTRLEIDNAVAPTTGYGLVSYNAQGLVTGGRDIQGSDLPIATSATNGVIQGGTQFTIAPGGTLSHSNSVTPGTYTKVTVDGQGHVSSGGSIDAADVPNLPASKITSGTLDSAVYANNSIGGTKLANFATVKFGGAGSTSGVVTFPTADYTGQMFFDSTNGDLYLFDGNTYQPVTVVSGDLVYAGTYDASTNLVGSTTTQGAAVGFTAGQALPVATQANTRYYVVVSDSGIGTSPAPQVALAPPDMLVSNGASYDLVDVSNAIAGQTAQNISFVPYGNIAATNVQTALQEVDDEKLNKAGDTVTGEFVIGSTGSFKFEGSTADDYETEIAVVNPTSDQTVTIPDQSGNFLISGNASIVNADIAANAAIEYSKLATLSNGNIIIGNGSGVATSTAMSGDVTINGSGVTSISSGVIVDADVNATAAIAFSKLANVSATDKLLGRSTSGSGPIEEITCTAAGRALIDDADAATQRTTLGLEIGVDVEAYDADIVKSDVVQTFTAAQRAEITTLTDGANISVDFADSNNFTVTLGGLRTLDNPTNQVAGQSGSIFVVQDGTGSRTLAYGTDYEFPGGTPPTLSTAAGAVDRIDYIVRASGSINCVFTANY
jgi:hypothetical protein